MGTFRILVAALTLCMSAKTAIGGLVIDGKSAIEMTINIADMPLKGVLIELHEHFGFELEGLSNVDDDEAMNITISGSLSSILGRLLSNRNYVLIKSTAFSGEIAKLVIINRAFGSSSAPKERIPEPPPAANSGSAPF